MFLLTEISRFQSPTVVAHNVNETAVDGHEGGVDVGRGCEDNVKTGWPRLVTDGVCDWSRTGVGDSYGVFAVELICVI